MMCERVLQKANSRSGKQSGDWVTPCQRKENDYQQRQIEDRKKGEAKRHECLQEQGNQRNQNGCRNAKPVDLNLLIRCVSDWHVIEEVGPVWAEQRQPVRFENLVSRAWAEMRCPKLYLSSC